MILLMVSVIVFNVIAFRTVRGISKNKTINIWVFTCLFQIIFDVFISLKYQGYWYFSAGVDWMSIPAYLMLIPPVNLMFINWFPFNQTLIIKIIYIFIWEIFLLSYEVATMLPQPYGFFHYGWWNLWHSAVVNPFLLTILIAYYKWISKLEKEACSQLA